MLEGLYEVIAVCISFLIGLIIAKQYYKQFKANELDDALQDDTITKEEIQEIVSEAKDLLGSR